MANNNLIFTVDFVNQHIQMSNEIQDILEKSIELITSIQYQLFFEYKYQDQQFNEYKNMIKPELRKLVTDKIFRTGREENKKNIEKEVKIFNKKIKKIYDLIENHKEKFIEFSSKTEE